MQIPSEFAMT